MDIRFKIQRYYDLKCGTGKYGGLEDSDLIDEKYTNDGSIGKLALNDIFTDADILSIVATNSFEKTTTVPATNGLDQLPANLITLGQANKLIFIGTDMPTPFICYNSTIWLFTPYTPTGGSALTAAEVGEKFEELLFCKMGRRLAVQTKNDRTADAALLATAYTALKDALD